MSESLAGGVSREKAVELQLGNEWVTDGAEEGDRVRPFMSCGHTKGRSLSLKGLYL